MLFWFVRFVLEWIVWLILADKSRWREILPVCLFASWLSVIVESFNHNLYELWVYPVGTASLFINGFGIYIVVPYLFIQWIPRKKTAQAIIAYILLWVPAVLAFEFMHTYWGFMEYKQWWSLALSGCSDFVIFGLLYKLYDIFQLRKLR